MSTSESNVHREAEDILRQAGAERRAIGESIDKAIGICECEWHDEHEKAGDTVCPHCRGRITPQGRSERGAITSYAGLTLAVIGAALALSVLIGPSLAAPPVSTPTPTPFMAEHCGMNDRMPDAPDCPTPSPTPSATPTPSPSPTPTPAPTPVPCEDNEERLPDGTCQAYNPPEEFPRKPGPQRDDSLYPPPPTLFPSPTPIPSPISGPTDLPATGGEPGGER